LFSGWTYAQTPDKLAKEANALFNAEQYIEATPKYLQLLSLEPRNHFYNYRYGACMLFNSEKKPEALKYLKFAVSDENIDPEAYYFLARAYHLNYYFDKAIRSYKLYKSMVKDKTALKKDVDRQIEMCQNGLRLMSRVSDVIVKERKSSTYEDFFRLYNLKDIGGTIIVTEEFQSKIDKKRGHKPTVHIAADANIIFYSSFGEIDEGNKDIYYRVINKKGEWDDPVRLPNAVNTSLDEDFPYLDPSGTYLYFSSKGHNSMGGYDIFRVPFNQAKTSFGLIENLDFAISSPDDDLFYVVDKEYKHAYFASARQSEGGKIHVYRVMVNKFSSNAVLYAGNFLSTVNPNSKSANIQIKDVASGRIIDNVKTNSSNGSLSLSLPRGGSYEFIIQTDKTKAAQTIPFEAPFLDNSQLLKLNFLEEQAGVGTNIRIVLDLNYQFSEEERTDIMAAIFLAKSELLPNDALQDLMQTVPIILPDNSSIVNELGLEKFNPNELAQIANQDLNRLKENFRLNEEQRLTFLALAAESIERAQSAEERINQLIQIAENGGLIEQEISEIKILNLERNEALSEARIALNFSNAYQDNATYLQNDIAQADQILKRIQRIEKKEDLVLLNDLSDVERVYMIENFNKIQVFDRTQPIKINENADRISQINVNVSEIDVLKSKIAANQTEISNLNIEFDKVKKKDKPVILLRIEELQVEQEALEIQIRIKSKNSENLLAERDSLKNANQGYQQSLTINPTLLLINNNWRLLNAQLRTEEVKKMDQLTQNIVENNVVPTEVVIYTPNEIDDPDEQEELSPEEIELNNQLVYFENLRTDFRATLDNNSREIGEIEKDLQNTPANDPKTRLKLEQTKLELIEAQIETINKLSEISEDNETIDREFERYSTMASVSENNITELSEAVVENQSNTANSNPFDPTSESQNAVVVENPNESNEIENVANQNEQVVRNQALLAMSEISVLKIQFDQQIDLIDVNNATSDDLLRAQDYMRALVKLEERHTENPEYLKVIAEERKRTEIWIYGVNVVLENQNEESESNIASNENQPENSTESINPNANPETNEQIENVPSSNGVLQRAVVSEKNEEAVVLATEIAALKSQSDELSQQLERTESRAEEKKILREIAKVEQEIAENQYQLLLAERENYEEALQSVISLAPSVVSKDLMLSSEMLILEQRYRNAIDVVDVLANASRSDQTLILVEAIEIRQDFLDQMALVQNQVIVKDEINRVVQQTGMNSQILQDPNKNNFALLQITEEIQSTEEKIKKLKESRSAFKASELPAIDEEIRELNEHLEKLEALKSKTKRAIQNENAGTSEPTDIPQINSELDLDILQMISESDLNAQISNPQFVELRNDIVSFTLMQNRMQNRVNQQAMNRAEMQALVLQIVQTNDENVQSDLRQRLDSLALSYHSASEAIIAIQSELNRMQQRVNSNPLYTQNPNLYHALALSPQVQESLLQPQNIAASQNTVNNSVLMSGITFLTAPKLSNAASAIGLNPVQIPGMIYKIQIGAFSKPVDLARFSDFEPVTTDEVGNNLIRYSAGLFYTKAQAFSSLGPIKALGYSDAFVVAYCDGVRYTIAEADELLRQGKCSLNQDLQMAFDSRIETKNLTYAQGPNAAPAEPLEPTEGLLFTVQIGVFNAPISHERLQRLTPLNVQLTEKNQIRYSIGKYDVVEDAAKQRDAVRLIGFTDAFVVAYYNGERITIAEAKTILETQGAIALHSNRTKLVNPTLTIATTNVSRIEMDSLSSSNNLFNFPTTQRYVSQKNYGKLPANEISTLRNQGFWAYYDEKSGKIVTSMIQNSTQIPSGFVVQSSYQGFAVQETSHLSLEQLEGFENRTTYYRLVMNWEEDLPRLVAYFLEQNFTEYIAQWNHEEGSVEFLPLSFLQKERIRRALMPLGDVRISETILTF